MERILAETSDAGDFELRTMALTVLGRDGEARESLKGITGGAHPPIFLTLAQALEALLDGRREEAVATFANIVAAHTDPEAFFMYGACQAHLGDAARALATLAAGVETGFTVPQALAHPWLQSLPREALDPLRARAEAGRAEAERAFEQAGGPALLGMHAGLHGGGVAGREVPPRQRLTDSSF
jgi:hypothetical protein